MAIPWFPSMNGPLILAALVAVFAVRRIWFEVTVGVRRRRLIREHGCQPPYHYPHKGILGKLIGLDVIRELGKSNDEGRMNEATRLRQWNDGRMTLQLRVMRRDVIATIEPENIKTVLSTKFPDFVLSARRRAVMAPAIGIGIFASDGVAWERSRALVRPNFVRAQVADLDMFEVHVKHLLDAIPRDGSTVDLQDLFFGLTMDSATEFLFGKSTGVLTSGSEATAASEFAKAFVYITDCVGKDTRSGGLFHRMPDRKWRRSRKIIHDFADETIREALSGLQKPQSGEAKRYVFLHELLQRTRDPVTLRSELLNILLAGRDTTASLLSNTWVYLAKRPDIWAKLRAEVDALDGGELTFSSIKEMKYLKWVLNESLRLMPVVPNNVREAARDTVIPLGGGPDGKAPVLVTKGTFVSYSPWSLHRREDYYGPDALEFRPERWEFLRPGWEYIPFNGGPRICVGQQYALMEASYATIRLIQTFPRIESRDDRDWCEWMTVTLASGVGCKVALFEK